MRQHKIAVIPGDGIGKEVIPAGTAVLQALTDKIGGFQFHFENFLWGSDYYRSTGQMMPVNGLDVLKAFDAIYFGAVGDPAISDATTLWGLRLAICQGLDQYANVRPIRLLPGIQSPLRNAKPSDLDWIVVRENSEGEYAGHGGRAHRGFAEEIATETAIFTRAGVSRIMEFAYKLALSRPRKLLTVVTKSNAQRHGLVLWDEVAEETSRRFPPVRTERVLVDAMTARMVKRPESLDVIVATNLHADILSDLAAALAGSLGIAPTANLDPLRRFPSMFEPIHGAAFDITGQGIANPLGAFWSAVLMLEHLQEQEAAAQLMSAIEQVTGQGQFLPADLGGNASTEQVTSAVCAAL